MEGQLPPRIWRTQAPHSSQLGRLKKQKTRRKPNFWVKFESWWTTFFCRELAISQTIFVELEVFPKKKNLKFIKDETMLSLFFLSIDYVDYFQFSVLVKTLN